jgi:hypothetical protein
MKKLTITTLTATGVAAAAGAILSAAPASAAGAAAGSSCPSDRLGKTATTSAGTTVRCLANGNGGFSWTGDTSAASTINQLQAQGYTVNIDRVGSGPLSACKVTMVRNPNTVTRTNRTGEGGINDIQTIIVSKSISVSLDCTGG